MFPTNFYYLNKYGHYVSANTVANAYLIESGKFPDNDQKGWLKYLNSIWGKFIIKACRVTVYDLINADMKIAAIQLYKEENKSTFCEAKDFVEKVISSKYA